VILDRSRRLTSVDGSVPIDYHRAGIPWRYLIIF
jgi:hypothetical protein